MIRRTMVFAVAMLAPALTCADAGSITVEKTACYGTCPAYTLVLYPDDSYDWNGRYFVARTGASHGHLPTGTYAAVLARFESIRYRELSASYSTRDECPEWWTDNSSTTFTIMTATGTKTIAHYHGCRGFDREVELLALEDSLDRILYVPEIGGRTR